MLTYNHHANHFLKDGNEILLSEGDLKLVNNLRWWHSIPFSSSFESKGYYSPVEFAERFQIAKPDYRGKRVLDIGCVDGFYSFYAEACGAEYVLAIDDLTQNLHGVETLHLAKEILGSTRVNFLDLNLYELDSKYLGHFDIVMMFGVLYHLVHPMLGLEKAASMCKGDFLLETHYTPTDLQMPFCVLYPNNELAGDYSNWSSPNEAWIRDALAVQGFSIESKSCWGDRFACRSVRDNCNHLQHVNSSILNAHRDSSLLKI